jgi:SulP family sulfate permease
MLSFLARPSSDLQQQYSYSVYASRAKAGRFELSIVIVLMAVLFLCSGLIMPYVPTVLASVLVLFIGIELFLEAIWEASKTLAWMEYAVVVATLAACTFLGFAEGFGVGIGAATVVYFMYGVMDSVRTFSNSWTVCLLFLISAAGAGDEVE